MDKEKEKVKIDKKLIKQWHADLVSDEGLLSFLLKRRGINKETVLKYEIGYDAKSERMTIPVLDSMEEYVNVRKWKDEQPKMISYAHGYGESRLFPIRNLQKDEKKVVICEGEWDCLLLNQNGINAVTNTTGCQTWKEEWNTYFKGFDVVVIYDCDDPGRSASKKLKESLLHMVKSLKIVDLKLSNREDLTDWFIKYKKDVKELVKLVRDTKYEDMYEHIDLANSMNSEYYGKHIKFNGVVIGKDLSPYLIPKKVQVRCNTGARDGKACIACPLNESGATKTKTYDYMVNKEMLIKMVNANDNQVKGIIRIDLCLPSANSCPGHYDLTILERQNVEDIQVIPEISAEHINQEYVVRRCYYFGLGCNANTNYLMRGTTWSDPNTQMGLHLVDDLEGNKDNISKFVLTDKMKKQLEMFQPSDQNSITAIEEKLADIYQDLTNNITKMYKREDIIMASDLVFHSVLQFKLLDRIETKGWVECAVIGDTKCGKTETIRNLFKHYKAGEFITSGENTSLAGILGGIQQINKRFIVTWGKLALNDKRIVGIDEADNLGELGILGKLSGVRSSGIAEIVKIQPQRTMARTRIIWIANPKHGRMNEKNYGIEVVKEIFEKQQDMSRIDFVIGVAKEDVSDEEINVRHTEKFEHKYDSDACHNCVMFAWSRDVKQIKITKDAESMILDFATRLGNKYNPAIPIVIGAEMRIKIARMACALACRLFSVDETYENVIVTAAHVQVVVDFIQKIYDGPVLGYKEYSSQRKREKELGNTSSLDGLIEGNEESISLLLDMNRIQLSDLQDIFGVERKELNELIKQLRINRLLKKVHTFYVKTPACIEYLKVKRDLLRADKLARGNEQIF